MVKRRRRAEPRVLVDVDQPVRRRRERCRERRGARLRVLRVIDNVVAGGRGDCSLIGISRLSVTDATELPAVKAAMIVSPTATEPSATCEPRRCRSEVGGCGALHVADRRPASRSSEQDHPVVTRLQSDVLRRAARGKRRRRTARRRAATVERLVLQHRVASARQCDRKSAADRGIHDVGLSFRP